MVRYKHVFKEELYHDEKEHRIWKVVDRMPGGGHGRRDAGGGHLPQRLLDAYERGRAPR